MDDVRANVNDVIRHLNIRSFYLSPIFTAMEIVPHVLSSLFAGVGAFDARLNFDTMPNTTPAEFLLVQN